MNSNKNPWKYFWLGILILATIATTAMATRANGNRQPNLRNRFTADNTRFVRPDARIGESSKKAELSAITNVRWWPPIWKLRAASNKAGLRERLEAREVRTQDFTNLRGDERVQFYRSDRLLLQRTGPNDLRVAKVIRARQSESRFDNRDQANATRIHKGNELTVRAARPDRNAEVARSAASDLRRLDTQFDRTPEKDALDSERTAHNRSNRDARPTEAAV